MTNEEKIQEEFKKLANEEAAKATAKFKARMQELEPKTMKNLTTMSPEEKKAHFSKILGKINKSKYIVEDVTPKGYGN